MKSEETNHGLRFVRTVRGVFLGVAALVLFAPRADAQKLAVKANALSWFTTTPQAEVEGAVGSLDGGSCGFVQPVEVRR